MCLVADPRGRSLHAVVKVLIAEKKTVAITTDRDELGTFFETLA